MSINKAYQFFSRESDRIARLQFFYIEGMKIWRFQSDKRAWGYAELRVHGMDFIKAFRRSKTGIEENGN